MSRQHLMSLIIAASLFESGPASAQTVIAPGMMVIDGYPVACGPSRTILAGSDLNDLARGGPAGIFLNWPVFSRYPTGVKIFVYAHECAHFLYGGDENRADRFAINLGRDQGWINEPILHDICASIYMSAGDWTHLPGPYRCNNMIHYYLNG